MRAMRLLLVCGTILVIAQASCSAQGQSGRREKGRESWEYVIPPELDEPGLQQDGVLVVKRHGATAVVDVSGKVVIEYGRFAEILDVPHGPARAVDANGNIGYIDNAGKVVIEHRFSDAGPFTNGLAMARAENGWGFIDIYGKWAIPPEYESVRSFRDGIAPVKKNGKWGLIRTDGVAIVPCRFDWLGWPECNRITALQDELWGYIDTTGEWVVEPAYKSTGEFMPSGVAIVQYVDGHWGIIDLWGRPLTESDSYSFIDGRMCEGLAALRKDGRIGYINARGDLVIEPKYHAGGAFSEGRASVGNDEGRYGYIDRTGELVIDYSYTDVRPFSEGVAAVEVRVGTQARWGYIDHRGVFVIEPAFRFAKSFHEGVACVKSENGRWGYIRWPESGE